MLDRLWSLGYPFDPTGAWNFDFPSSIRLTGKVKHIVRKGLGQKENDVVYGEGVASALMDALGTNDASTIEMTKHATSDMVRMYNLIKSKGKERNRLFSIAYNYEVMEVYYQQMASSPLSVHVKIKEKIASLITAILEHKGIDVNFEGEYFTESFFNGDRQLMATAAVLVTAMKMSDDAPKGRDNRSQDAKRIVFTLMSELHNSKFQKDIILCIWGISFLGFNSIPFMMFCLKYRHLVDIERFPFISQSAIKFGLEGLEENTGVSNDEFFDTCRSASFIYDLNFKLENFEEAAQSIKNLRSASMGVIDLIRSSYNSPLFPSINDSLATLNEVIVSEHERVLASFSTGIDGALGSNVANFLISEPEAIKVSPDKEMELFADISKTKHTLSEFNKSEWFDDDIEDHRELIKSNQLTLTRLDAKIKELSADTVTNFEEIAELVADYKATKNEVNTLSKAFLKLTQKRLDDYEMICVEFKDRLKSATIAPGAKQESVSKEEYQLLEAELADSNRREGELRERLERLAKAAENTQLQGDAAALELEHDVVAEVISSAYCSQTVESVFDSVALLNAGRVVLSDKARRSVVGIGNFKYLPRLFSSLNTLCSAKFLKLYGSGGSKNAFEFFTKKELSFQESKGTKSGIGRKFHFPDGQTRDCRAHLRIGVDNTEQNMLRVYFAIEGGVVYIGEVSRHLPTMKG